MVMMAQWSTDYRVSCKHPAVTLEVLILALSRAQLFQSGNSTSTSELTLPIYVHMINLTINTLVRRPLLLVR